MMSSSLTRTKMLKLLVAMQMELLRVQFNLQVVCSGSEDTKSLAGLIYRESEISPLVDLDTKKENYTKLREFFSIE